VGKAQRAQAVLQPDSPNSPFCPAIYPIPSAIKSTFFDLEARKITCYCPEVLPPQNAKWPVFNLRGHAALCPPGSLSHRMVAMTVGHGSGGLASTQTNTFDQRSYAERTMQ